MTHRLVRGRDGVGETMTGWRGDGYGVGGGRYHPLEREGRGRACGVLSKVCLVHSLHVIVYALSLIHI